ncbi:MAG: insulinase family protein [Clostridia bacterium]|nr:insulinase family protein [Clostridia bacterium]
MNKLVRSELLNEEYRFIKHKSGLDIYIFPKALSTSYAVIATKFGSIDNCFKLKGEEEFTKVPDGIAHFLEHKMFENEDGEDTFVKFSRTGADGNAFTSFKDTAYLFSCTENLYESLEILLKSTFSPYFTEENVKKEQGIIAQEIKMGEDDPSDALFQGILSALYEKSSLRIDIAGSVDSIMKITPELLYKCHSAFYNPSNMILCVSGQADENEVMRVVDKILSESTPKEVESFYEKEPKAVFKKKTLKKMAVSKPLFCIGIKDTEISEDAEERMKKNAAIQLISSIYFGRSSDLYNELYKEGLISPSFSSWSQHNKAFSFFTVSGDSSSPDSVLERFNAYIKRITENSISKEDFERCRRAQYSKFVKLFDSTEEIANTLVTEFATDGGEIFRFAEILGEITPEYTEGVLKQLFNPDFVSMSVILPI